MKTHLREPFFTRRERDAIFILAGLILTLNIARSHLPKNTMDFSEDIAEFIATMDSLRDIRAAKIKASIEYYKTSPFDINMVSDSILLSIGIPDELARRLLKYRNKVGGYRRMEDLKRLYDMSDSTYHLLCTVSFCQKKEGSKFFLDKKKNFSVKKDTQKQKKHVVQKIVLDINLATAKDWAKLYGIGPVLSERIVKFRDRLGGFHSVDQVGDTYGLSPETFTDIKKQLFYHTPHRRIKFSADAYETLAAHLLINKRQAYMLVNYMRENGPIESLVDLKRSEAFTREEMEALMPYLAFEP